MKLLGRNINGKRLVDEVRARLNARGVLEEVRDAPLDNEARVDPLGYLVQALEDDADPAQPPPATAPLGRLGGVVRFAVRGLLEELLGRQRSFNVHVRDLAAQLSEEVIALRERVTELERLAKPPAPPRRLPSKRQMARAAKRGPRPRPR